jgi:hypothetical protein
LAIYKEAESQIADLLKDGGPIIARADIDLTAGELVARYNFQVMFV